PQVRGGRPGHPQLGVGALMRVLIVNTGSTSVKLRLLGSDDALLGRCDFPVVDGTIPVDAMTGALEQLGAFDAVGHRVVHGGTVYRSAVRVDDTVLQQLQALVELAPLHQPQALAAIEDRKSTRLNSSHVKI